jgi:hypothetical protein
MREKDLQPPSKLIGKASDLPMDMGEPLSKNYPECKKLSAINQGEIAVKVEDPFIIDRVKGSLLFILIHGLNKLFTYL